MSRTFKAQISYTSIPSIASTAACAWVSARSARSSRTPTCRRNGRNSSRKTRRTIARLHLLLVQLLHPPNQLDENILHRRWLVIADGQIPRHTPFGRDRLEAHVGQSLGQVRHVGGAVEDG